MAFCKVAFPLWRHLPATSLAVACALSGCGRQPAAISFADYLRHQKDNLTTGLISVPTELNTHLLAYGWHLQDGSEKYAELTQSVGHVRLFVARDELRQLVIRGASDPQRGFGRYRLLINGDGLGRATFAPDWREQRFDLPPGSLRIGPNLLVLRCQECPPGERQRLPHLRLQQIRWLPAPANRQRIRPTAGGGFSMPTPAYLDVVDRLPSRAAFRAELLVPPTATDSVTVALDVLDAAGERRAGEWRLGGGRRPRTIRADLEAWAGSLVRLRLSAAGGVELQWLHAEVTGRGGPAPHGRLPLAEPAAPPRTGRLGRPDIVLVLLDAARGDAFQPFGGPYPTPVLERLAAGGTRFSEALSPASWTLPSVVALLSGSYPDSVGAEAWGIAMRRRVPTMAQILSAAGYRTVLWHQHPFYRGRGDLLEGFDEVYWARTNLVDPVPPGELLWAEDRPTFTLAHLLPPHAPYSPPEPFRGAYSSWYRGGLEVTARALNQFHGRRDPRQLSADERRYIRDRYLENVAYADSLVGRIRDLLLAAKRWDDSLFVVLSDHGEAFLEHGRFLHTQQLYRESIHVPLIVKWPATTTGYRPVVEQPVSLIDLLPTLVDGLGLAGEKLFQGRSLLPAALDGNPGVRPVYSVTRGAAESWRPPAPRRALRYGRWKAIYEPLADRLELYDVAADPGETRNLADSRPTTALLLRQALLEQRALNAGLLGADEPPASEPLDPEVEERLRDLGYLGPR